MSKTESPDRSSAQPVWRRALGWIFRWRTLIWLVAIALVVYVFSEVPWGEVLDLLTSLTLLQVALVVAINALMVVTVGGRDWVLLRASDQRVPLRSTCAYFLAGFAFSFFTPGPQLSGAPLQVYLIQRDYQVDTAATTAAIAVGKLLEGVVNVGFLIFSFFAILNLGFFPRAAAPALAGWAMFLLTVVGGYLLFTWNGRQPLSWLLARLPEKWVASAGQRRFIQMLTRAEKLIGTYFGRHPWALAAGLSLSLLTGVLVVLQAWLAVYFLGVQLNLLEIVSVLVTVQIAVLFPTPAGLGAVEAAMVFVFQRLGYSSGVGAAFALLMRLRDLGIGSAGLVAGGWSFVRGQEQIESAPEEAPFD